MSLIIDRAANTSDGTIKSLNQNQIEEALAASSSFIGPLCKFTPASGAATRMFKPLFEEGPAAEKLLENLKKKTPIDFSVSRNILSTTPKGLLPFHRYEDSARTPFEEHLAEGAGYAKDKYGNVNLYFTVSEEHIEEFKALAEARCPEYERKFGCKFAVHFSVQDHATDVTAYDAEGKPFVKEDGTILKRPAGHGALLKNLALCREDFIFIKNIDNVVKEAHLQDTVLWKKILLGRAIMLRGKVVEAIDLIEKEQDRLELAPIVKMLSDEFGIVLSDTSDYRKILEILNRPIRVCGMVKNQGEAGGGPFVCCEKDGSTSLQILEAVQIEDKSLMQKATHFNPVDLVCCIKDAKGNFFDLQQFTDPDTGLAVEKTFEGRTAKYTELPGLWNGSMSRWLTQFVEVPLSTFNPVKTVADLLRPAHQ